MAELIFLRSVLCYINCSLITHRLATGTEVGEKIISSLEKVFLFDRHVVIKYANGNKLSFAGAISNQRQAQC